MRWKMLPLTAESSLMTSLMTRHPLQMFSHIDYSDFHRSALIAFHSITIINPLGEDNSQKLIGKVLPSSLG